MTEKIHRILDLIISKWYAFAAIFFAVSFTTFTVLYATGLVPEVFKVPQASGETQEPVDYEEEASPRTEMPSQNRPRTERAPEAAELPIHIRIQKAGVDSSVSNPESSDIPVLDEALKHGVVRYPGSGKPGEGNMLLFGHSTSYKVVNNRAYQALNGIQNLEKGDMIAVETPAGSYEYSVTSVKQIMSSDARVDFDNGKDMLTLSTCNVFGAKEERHVVEADFVRFVPREA